MNIAILFEGENKGKGWANDKICYRRGVNKRLQKGFIQAYNVANIGENNA